MDQRFLETLLLRQRSRIDARQQGELYERRELNEINLETASPLLITGMRGSGKTTMCIQLLNRSRQPWAYIDFDEERLRQLDENDVDNLLEVLFKTEGNLEWVLLDEIRHVPQAARNALISHLQANGIKLIMTASCSPLQKFEGVNVVPLYPYSFAEYCRFHGVDTEGNTARTKGALRAAFDEYLMKGGLPAVQNMARPRRYINETISTVLKTDIETPSLISNMGVFDDLGRYLLAEGPVSISYKGLANQFAIKSEHTIKKYIEHLKSTGMFCGMPKLALWDKQRLIGEKIFASDPGLLNDKGGEVSIERRMETVLHTGLMRTIGPQGYMMHHFVDRTTDCGFVLCRNMVMKIAMQILYDPSDEKLLRRKIAGLLSVAHATGCEKLLIVTDTQSRDIEAQGYTIHLRPLYRILLDYQKELEDI